MNLQEFQAFAFENREWLEGSHPETEQSLLAAEASLGCRLPPTMKWLLAELGYSGSCGLASLSALVETTLRCRDSMGLPHRYIILNDWNDAGVVYLDTHLEAPSGEFPITWTSAYNLNRLAVGEEPDGDCDLFEDYPAWLMERLGTFKEEAESNNTESEQDGTGQPATRPVVQPEGGDKPQPDAEGRSR